ncbi:MAG: M20/M25/M40 family metallo-hydrolase [Planctomycetota bacterium]
MTGALVHSLVCVLAVTAQEPASLAPPVQHLLQVRLEPEERTIDVVDTVTLPASLLSDGAKALSLRLHAALAIESRDPAIVIEPAENPAGSARFGINDEGAGVAEVPLREYLVRPARGKWPETGSLRLAYHGEIHHPLVAEEQEYARSFSRTPGLIDAEGVVLSGSTWWYPTLTVGSSSQDQLLRFRLVADLPKGWSVVTQGERAEHGVVAGRSHFTWDCPYPMDEIYLVAARFTEYHRQAGNVQAFAFLRSPDPDLAAKYLEATAQYIEMYRELIGPYPFAQFALVENFWETGYGMPSFTLLGPKIIRFPFILHSSYPHEILHNWWGNSVFVAFDQGNWCEGLTAYLADHLIKEGQGKGREYRQDTLKSYLNYVRESRDFPLTAFRARHSSASEAVGYGKSMMLFHMLRDRVGDDAFKRALQTFYRRFKFQRATFDDIERVFSETVREDLQPFFRQWVERVGAVDLELGSTTVHAEADGDTTLRVEVRQTQGGEPYTLTVPMAVTLEGEEVARLEHLHLDGPTGILERRYASRPLHVRVDPDFDLFRRLHRSETPPTIGQLFGAERVTIVLPVETDPMKAAWESFARAWTGSAQAQVEIRRGEETEALPSGPAVWLLGAGNRFADVVREGVRPYGTRLDDEWIDFGETKVPRAGHCFVLATTHPEDPDAAIGWVGADIAAALPGLARKLPHYGKYSYLAFRGEEPTNDAKGQWPVVGSPLARELVDGPVKERLPASGEPLARLEPVFDVRPLMGTVNALASDELEGRGVGTAGLDQAGDFIAERFAEYGLEAGGDEGSYFHAWVEPEGPRGEPVTLRNVIAVLRGARKEWEQQSVVVGAHYDHLGRGWPDVRSGMEGQVHNGADDNASGVAVLLEVARLLAAESHPERTIVFVAFSGEEWGLKGSREYVRSMERWPVRDALAMINLDTVGRLQGKKLTVLGAGSATEWVHIAMGIGFTTGIESTVVPDDFGGSDQKPFLEAGVPAIQLFTGPHEDYHRPSDDVEKIDAGGLVKVALFLREAVLYLGAREERLTSNLDAGRETAAPSAQGRKVSLGTMPDFAFGGPGVRVAKVVEGSPAASAGLEEGDVILAIDAHEVADLRAYSESLKACSPGQVIRIRLRRGKDELTLEATLVSR